MDVFELAPWQLLSDEELHIDWQEGVVPPKRRARLRQLEGCLRALDMGAAPPEEVAAFLESFRSAVQEGFGTSYLYVRVYDHLCYMLEILYEPYRMDYLRQAATAIEAICAEIDALLPAA